MLNRLSIVIAACAALTLSVNSVHASTMQTDDADAQPTLPEALIDSMQWRNIGPARGGRVQTVAGIPGDDRTYYMGATGGGVWKTTDAGATWKNISDDFFNTGSVGAIAVAESDPNVIYVGMGEADIRGNFSHGDGVYKSLDAGKTWTHIGLKSTEQIGDLIIHPRDENVAYVAALGHVFGPNEQRGVFRTTDGGKTWDNIHFIDNHTGAIDLAFDPTNPRTLFAAMWQVKRTPWGLESGGNGSGLYRSTDAGETWEELTKGLPEGIKGKIGIAISPVNPQRVWALVEAKDGGVFRSDDGGDNFHKLSTDPNLRQRAWYYTHIIADTQEENTVYVMNVGFHKSTDGGKTFGERIRVPHSDNHGLWIDPDNNQRMINANDGGANVSFDGGQSWSTQTNQPTAQFYHVTTDNQYPYRVYGAQQDNSTASVSSRGSAFGNWQRDLYPVGGGESGYIAVRPDNPNIVYAGSYSGYLTRYDHETGLTRNIMVWPENPMGWGVEALDYRVQWTFPIVISPHNPDVLYTGSQFVHRSTDEGLTWEQISPDLSVADPATMKSSGGPITKDNTGVEYYATVFTIAESLLEKGLIWAGSDDGLIHVTNDGGENWVDVTPEGMDEWPLISLIEASPHDADTAYAAVNRYKMDDKSPYIYKTTDRGKSWSLIVDGIEAPAFVRAVREDPTREGLLYAATEVGVYYSLDGGSQWQSLQSNLPIVPVTDLVVKGDDLVISTQGRSFWILDNITALRAMSTEVANADVHLFAPAATVHGSGGVAVQYWLADEPGDEIKLSFFDSNDELIKEFVSDVKEDGNEGASEGAKPQAADDDEVIEGEDADEDEEPSEGLRGRRKIPADAGMNTFTWNTRHADATDVPGAIMWAGSTRGPAAIPGQYRVELLVGDAKLSQPIDIVPDPRVETTAEEYEQQLAFLLEVRDRLDETHQAINTIRTIRTQVQAATKRANEAGDHSKLKSAAKSLTKALTGLEQELIQTKSKSSQDPLNYPIKLNNKIAALSGMTGRHYPPTAATIAVFDQLKSELAEQMEVYKSLIANDVPAFNALVREANVPAIVIEADEEE